MLRIRVFRIAVGAAFLMAVSFVVASVILGGADYVLPYLQGRRLLVKAPRVSINDLNDRVVIPVVLTNIDSQAITVISANTSCSCATIEKLPLTVPARESITIQIAYTPSKVGSTDSVSVVLITDRPNEAVVPLVLRCDEQELQLVND